MLFWSGIFTLFILILLPIAIISGNRSRKKLEKKYSWSTREELNQVLVYLTDHLLEEEKETLQGLKINVDAGRNDWLFWKRLFFFEVALEYSGKCETLTESDLKAICELHPSAEKPYLWQDWTTCREILFEIINKAPKLVPISYEAVLYMCQESFTDLSFKQVFSETSIEKPQKWHTSIYDQFLCYYLKLDVYKFEYQQ